MKKLLFVLCVVLIPFAVRAGIKPELIRVVSDYPSDIKRAEDLAQLINNDFKTDLDKAAAIYTWIALNINYDVKSYFSNSNKPVSYSYKTLDEKAAKEKAIEDKTIKTTLRKNIAVCEGYATLYKRISDLCGVKCVIISGASRNSYTRIGKEPKGTDHAWNAIMIDNQWHLLDVTWGAGSVDPSTRKFQKKFTDGYFMTDPDRFFTQHFPEDERWLLIDRDKKDFASLPYFHDAYLFSKDALVNPTKGQITKLKKGNVEFKLRSHKEITQLYYAFERDKHSTRLDIIREDDFIYFKVPIGNKKSGYLTIYEGSQPLFSFKLNIK